MAVPWVAGRLAMVGADAPKGGQAAGCMLGTGLREVRPYCFLYVWPSCGKVPAARDFDIRCRPAAFVPF